MSDFHVTEEMATEREDEVIAVGALLGFDSTFIDVSEYDPWDRESYQRYLTDNFVQFFSVEEVIRPHHKRKAAKAGFTELIPPPHLWPWSLLILRIGDVMREEIDAPIKLRNLYRPQSYNELVANSDIDSDHPNACSCDFDFNTQKHRRKAEKVIRDLSKNHPEMKLSMGMGGRSLHVGVLSPKGHRSWFYDSYTDTRVKLI